MSITTGTVSVEDGTKAKEEYAPARKVRVDLSFDVPEGGDAAAILDYASQLASQQVQRQLGRAVDPVSQLSPTTAAEQAWSPVEQPKRTRRTAEQIRADDAAKAAAAHAAHSVVEDPDVKAHIEDNKPAADASEVVSDDASEVVSDDAGDEDWAVEAEVSGVADEAPVTDAELNDAVQKKNGELKDPPKIRALIGSFNPDPTKVFQLREVPAERRREFLTSLAALK